MTEIALIGAGQLGSRHLQALAGLDASHSIHVVEPFAVSVERARARWAEVVTSSAPTVHWLSHIEALPPAIAIAIVATGADTRRAAVEALLARVRVDHLVLEKVLFQSLDDYAAVAALLRGRVRSAWVNYPRRLWPFYERLQGLLRGEETRRLSVCGSRWGLASNTIHFLDLFAYLGGGTDLSIDTLRVTETTSTRPGFVELTGELHAHASAGHATIASLASGDAPLLVEIVSPSVRALVRESEGKAWIATRADSWAWKEWNVEAIPQSQLSHLVVQDLLATGSCRLTPLDESISQHLAFLTPLSRHFGATTCPIT